MISIRWVSCALLLAALFTGVSGCVLVVSPFGSGDDTLRETTLLGEGDAKILWLPISGFISDSPTRHALGLTQSPSTLAEVTRALDKAEDDDDIAALVLRIESPGGTVAAADEIHARIQRYHENTGVPVIASLGGVATSGGYYVAVAADTIIAQPTTVTGSIGVILMGVNAEGLLAKLGIENETYTTGAHKDLLSPLRGATAEERAIVQDVLDALFAQFVTAVEQGRPNLDRSRIQAITDGRIFAADRARKLGLVDTVGHIDAALALARQKAGVEAARIIRYYSGRPAPRSLLSATDDMPAAAAREPAPGLARALSAHDRPQPLYLWQPGTAAIR